VGSLPQPARLDPASQDGTRALRRLVSEKIGWLTTVNPAGQPQASPIWFLWEGRTLLVYSHRRAPRNHNIEHDEQVAFNLNTDVNGDDVVTMEGIARVVSEGPPASGNEPYLDKYREMIADYGWTNDWFAGEYPVLLRITPTRWRFG
jgi:PPOX class probable F420-dependent enzyme